MLALNDIIDFLLHLLNDDNALAAFEQDPHRALADAGLRDVTAHDVRDAQLVLADRGAAAPHSGSVHHAGGHDPIREISYTAQHFHAVPAAPGVPPTITIDDRDTFFVRNSIDSHDNVTVVQDSFNHVSVDNSTDNSSVTNDVTAIQDNDTTTVVDVHDNNTINQVPTSPASAGPSSADPGSADPGSADPGNLPADGSPDPFAPDAHAPDLLIPGSEPDAEPDLHIDPEPDPQLDADPGAAGVDHGADIAAV